MKSIVVILLLLLTVIEVKAIERSRVQFLSEPSYLLLPLPYSMPGIGEGLMVTALAGNIDETNIDAYFVGITGDAEGIVFAIEDIHLLPEFLILDIMHQDISKAVVNSYNTRGMNSNKSDYKLLEVDQVYTNYAKLTLTMFERRVELYAILSQQKARITKIRDPDGEVISDLTDPFISDSMQSHIGFLIDYTDDKINPKKGIRLDMQYISSKPQSSVDPKFYTIDTSLSTYIPIIKPVTLAFNLYLSDAFVTKEGVTDRDLIKAELGLNCSGDSECLKAEEELINIMVDSRTNGTATGLGGDRRLRAYPGDRYSGAHTLYSSIELRWNLSEKIRPFNFWIWKDVATGLQIAPFYEIGSVSEKIDDLGNTTRESYGVGFRLVSASGFVYRADYAQGNEGKELTVMFSYPW